MAKVSHLPMRRYQTDHSQSSTGTNVDAINFYPPANANHRTSSDKNKRTWGQRFKLSKASPEQSSNSLSSNTASSTSSSLTALSSPPSSSPSLEVLDYSSLQHQHQQQLQQQQHLRYVHSISNAPLLSGTVTHSMKYVESNWMYGTMRGMPLPMGPMGHPHHIGHQQQQHPGLIHPMAPMYCPMPAPPVGPEVAVVICCCPEYLNGTKREVKKASVCKKCKGSRLPLAPIGGTMRLTSGATFMVPPVRGSAGTVKLASTYGKKTRPTILGSAGDPYDFMRRSRLSQPEQAKPVKSSIKEKLRGRAKSTSPTKGRSRTDKRTPSPAGSKSSGSRSLSASRSSNSNSKGFKDCWVEPEELPVESDRETGRRSILRCDINPYDLISLSSGLNNEFSPTNGMDEYDLSVHSQKYENLLDTLYANRYNPAINNIAAISGQRIKLFDGDPGTTVYDDVDEYVYDPVEVQGITAVQETRVEVIPERPPRTKQKHDSTKIEEDLKSLPSQISSEMTQSAIKSILKRPASVTSVPTDLLDKPSFDTIRLNQTLVHRLTKLTSDEGVFAKSNSVSARNVKTSFGKEKENKRLSGSQFYLPNPLTDSGGSTGSVLDRSRKKVHFLVENEIIDDDKFFAQLLLSETNGHTPALLDAEPTTTTMAATVTIVEVTADSNGEETVPPPAPPPLPPPPPTQTAAALDHQNNESVIMSLVNHQDNRLPVDSNGVEPKQQTRLADGNRNDKLQHRSLPVPTSFKQNHSPNKETPVKTVKGAKASFRIESICGNTNSHGLNGDGGEHDGAELTPWGIRRRTGPNRRSFSERTSPPRVTSFNGTTDLQHQPNFFDTMALRNKQPRPDTRRAFDEETLSTSSFSSSSGSSSGTILTTRMRPRVPPPPPPPPASLTGSASPDQQSISSNDTCSGRKKFDNHSKPEDNSIYEEFCFDLSSGSERSSGRSSTASRTIVQVSTPVQTSFNKDAVHRLEIRHEDEDSSYESMGQKKTSILITGDDCYSTVNVDDDDETPRYQSSVVVNDVVAPAGIHQTSSNTVTISVNSPTSTLQHPRNKNSSTISSLEEMISKNNMKNSILNSSNSTSIIPIGGPTSISVTAAAEQFESSTLTKTTGKTLISLDFAQSAINLPDQQNSKHKVSTPNDDSENCNGERSDTISIVPNEANSKDCSDSIEQLLRNPVEAVRRNLVPHYCGKLPAKEPTDGTPTPGDTNLVDGMVVIRRQKTADISNVPAKRNSFITKLLEDPMLGHLTEGLDYDLVTKLIENSLLRLKDSRTQLDMSGTKDEDDVSKMIEESLKLIKEERLKMDAKKVEKSSNRSSISSGNSYGSAAYELMEFDATGDLSDCYQSCSSDLTTDDDVTSSRSKFYQMLVDATLSEIEITTANDDEHHYESIRMNSDPIYEEISDIPPPLPLTAPPVTDDLDREKRNARSIFEGASKYDILSYLVDAKERGIAQEEAYNFQFGNASDIILEEEEDENITELRHHQRQISDISSRLSHISNISDSSEETSLLSLSLAQRKTSEIERNDSGVGSETSKTSRSKWQNPCSTSILDKISPIHLCEDCDGPVETQITESGVMYAPLVCRKCGKKRAERKEIITEIVETEEKYGRDLQIILEEFYQPMLVAGLLNQDQLSAIFLNVEELLENNQFLAERMRDALDIATEQGDEDLLTVNAGRIFLEAAPMLHAFESYCVRQGAASLLLANLEKEKELLRIFLRVSQMENAVLRRMNLNSFLMVPVQRVTKYPLLLARLFKVTPPHQEGKELLKQAQEKIELHLNHMNREAKDVPTKLWRRISSSTPTGRRLSCELDMINIKLRKMAIDVLEWNTEEVRFAIEGRLLFTQPNDGNWKKSRTIKLTSINALLVTNGKPSPSYKPDRAQSELVNFPRHTGIREASLLLVREKNGRYTLLREPLYLDRCIVCTENDWEDYFEVQEILSKESFIFKAEDGGKTKQWYSQLQYHSQGMGTWRKRRNALANIMINGMMTRT
ncbi:uncharacterized protein LOC131437068 [Malaya genurostris]|uniref:uncharacterized protein LOC131437068 n=1 Tax=Malaya genurostris TaxID=325434 RepID=UPI0026F3C82D|nr:uncharacterized protein LOC131437068 [Malaya genurostris]XP_058462106.1 uncharacterized protein LOC131437068 [Malaya genurostris]XP_058462107.1 uncharacterized protein LOC131437068 [Malaya genurostris]XP_058462108.1 uncharacterized protein LOC131437068 [Malaya genurostris]XP_058462109.1 uncharacterized protein LOC131437068 [Malaya genurostris]XP_058462110.1 uncharacterized protein LOC131437068 [Malaya genurostris]XP_058462111.1 uncharacterized protein LOC131437068 [Malaya genurostris]